MISDLNLDHINLLKSSEFSREKLFNFQEGGKVECNFCNEAFHGAGSAHKHLTYDCAVAGLRKIGGSRLTYSNQTTMTFLEQSPLETLERKVFEITGVLCPPDSSRELMIALLREYAKYYKQNIRHHEIRLYLQNALRDITMRENELKYSNGVQINNYNIQIGDYDRKLKEYQNNYDFYTARQNQFQGQMRYNQAEQSVVNSEIQRLQGEITNLKSQLAQCSSRTKLDEATLQQLEAQILALGGQSQLGQQAVGVVQSFRGIQEQQQQVKSEQMVAKSRLDDYETELEKYKNRISSTISDFSESSSRSAQTVSSNLTFNSDFESVRSSITKRIDQLEKERDNLRTNTNDPVKNALNGNRRDSIDNELGSLKPALSQLGSDEVKIKALEGERDSWEKKYNKLDGKWKKLNTDKNEKLKFCNELIAKNADKLSKSFTQDISQNYILKSEHTAKIKELKDQIASRDAELQDLKKLKDFLESEDKEKKRIIVDLTEKKKLLESTLQAIKDKKQSEKAELNSAFNDLGELFRSIPSDTSLTTGGAPNDEDLSVIIGKLKTLITTNKEKFKTYISNTQDKISDLTSDKKRLDERVKEVEESQKNICDEYKKFREENDPDKKYEEYEKQTVERIKKMTEKIFSHIKTFQSKFEGKEINFDSIQKFINEQQAEIERLRTSDTSNNTMLEELHKYLDKNKDIVEQVKELYNFKENINNKLVSIYETNEELQKELGDNYLSEVNSVAKLNLLETKLKDLVKERDNQKIILNIIDYIYELTKEIEENLEIKDNKYKNKIDYKKRNENKIKSFDKLNEELKNDIIQDLDKYFNYFVSSLITDKTDLYELQNKEPEIDDSLITLISNIETKIEGINFNENELDKKIGQLVKERNNLIDAIKEINTNISGYPDIIAYIKSVHQQIGELQELKDCSDLEKIKQEKDSLRSQLELQKQSGVLTTSSSNVDCSSFEQKINKLEIEIGKKNTEIETLKSRLKSSKTQSVGKKTNKSPVQDLKENYDEQIRGLKEQNKKLQSEIDGFDKKIKVEKIKILNNLLDKKDELNVNTSDTKINEKIGELAEKIRRQDIIEKTIDELENEDLLNNNLLSTINQLLLNDDENKIKQKIEDIKKEIPQLEEEKKKINNKILVEKEEYNKYKSLYNDIDALINGFSKNLKANEYISNEEINQLKNKEITNYNKLVLLLGKWTALIQKIDEQIEENKKIENKINNFKNKTIPNFLKKITELGKKYKECNENIQKIEKELSEIRAEKATLELKITGLESEKNAAVAKAEKEEREKKAALAKVQAAKEEGKKKEEAALAKVQAAKKEGDRKLEEQKNAAVAQVEAAKKELKKQIEDAAKEQKEREEKEAKIKQCEEEKTKIIAVIERINNNFSQIKQITGKNDKNTLTKWLRDNIGNEYSILFGANYDLNSVICSENGILTNPYVNLKSKLDELNEEYFSELVKKVKEKIDTSKIYEYNCDNYKTVISDAEAAISTNKSWITIYNNLIKSIEKIDFNNEKNKSSLILNFDKFKKLNDKGKIINFLKAEKDKITVEGDISTIISQLRQSIKRVNAENEKIRNPTDKTNYNKESNFIKTIIPNQINLNCEKLKAITSKKKDFDKEYFNYIDLYEDIAGVVRIYARINSELCKLVKDGTIKKEAGENNDICPTANIVKEPSGAKINCSRKIYFPADEDKKEYGPYFGVFTNSSNRDLLQGFDIVNPAGGESRTRMTGDKSNCKMTFDSSRGIQTTIDQVLKGYNINIFGYGYSGSGKTFTLYGGGEDQKGIVQEVFNTEQFKTEKVKITRIIELYGYGTVGDRPQFYKNRYFNTDRKNRNLVDNELGLYSNEKEAINYFELIAKCKEKCKELKIEVNNNEITLNGEVNKSINFIIDVIEFYRKINGGIKATPNNPESSRGHLMITFSVGKGNLTIGDFGGIESPFDILRTFIPLEEDKVKNIDEFYKSLMKKIGAHIENLQSIDFTLNNINSKIKLMVNDYYTKNKKEIDDKKLKNLKEELLYSFLNKEGLNNCYTINKYISTEDYKKAFIMIAKLNYRNLLGDSGNDRNTDDSLKLKNNNQIKEISNNYGISEKVIIDLLNIYNNFKSNYQTEINIKNKKVDFIKILFEGFYINETLNNMKAYFLAKSDNYNFKDFKTLYFYNFEEKITFNKNKKIRFPQNEKEFKYIYLNELMNTGYLTNDNVEYSYDKFKSFYMPVFNDNDKIKYIMYENKDKTNILNSLYPNKSLRINQDNAYKRLTINGIRDISNFNKNDLYGPAENNYNNLYKSGGIYDSPNKYDRFICKSPNNPTDTFRYAKFNNYTLKFEFDKKNNNLTDDKVGMLSLLELLNENKSSTKPSKFVMLALINPRSVPRFIEGAKATLEYADKISSTADKEDKPPVPSPPGGSGQLVTKK